MKKLLSLITMFVLTLAVMGAEEPTAMAEAYHIYPYAEAPGKVGQTAELLLIMKNRTPINTWSCTLQLPEGVSVSSVAPMEEDGRYPEGYDPQISTITGSAPNIVSISCHGADDAVLTGTDGAVAVVTVNIGNDVAPGSYEVLVKDIILVGPGESLYQYNIDRKMNWTIEEAEQEWYVVTFMMDTGGEEYSQDEAQAGQPVPVPDDPQREGYTFTGWDPAIPDVMPAHDMTFVAQWQVNKYNVYYYIDNDLYLTQEVEYGATITAPADPEQEGYNFSGWNNLPETMPASDVYVHGSFEVIYYNIDFFLEAGGEPYDAQEVAYGEPLPLPDDPQREGYTFTGWDPAIPDAMPAHDMTFVAQWQVNSHTLRFVIDNDIISETTVDYGTPITAPDAPEKEGYQFLGWSQFPETMPDEDVIVTGAYEAVVEFITLSSQYVMFSCDKALDFTGSELKAYIATDYNRALNRAVLEEILLVPAGTGVMLVGETGQTYMIPYPEMTTQQVVEGNLFRAVTEQSWITPYDNNGTSVNYTLEEGQNYFAPLTGNGAEMPAGTAYLQLGREQAEEGSNVLFGFLDKADGINALRQNTAGKAVFDLQGRRVSQPARGIYIIDGKKVAFK